MMCQFHFHYFQSANSRVNELQIIKIGLTEEMVEEITVNPEFSEVLRLHNYVQKIKQKHTEVHQQATELRTMFDCLIQQANAGSANQGKEKRKGAAEAAGKTDGKK